MIHVSRRAMLLVLLRPRGEGVLPGREGHFDGLGGVVRAGHAASREDGDEAGDGGEDVICRQQEEVHLWGAACGGERRAVTVP